MDYSIIAIIMMILMVTAIGYYVNETISNKYYINDNLHKSFNAMFIGLQIGVLQLLYLFYNTGSLTTPQIILGLILIVATIYVGYKLVTLDYLINDRELVASLIEQRGLTLAMAKKSRTTNPELKEIIDKIKVNQTEEILELQDILKEL